MDFREQVLYHIWAVRNLKADLTTVSGKSIQILYHGQWNTTGGPDFVNAIIQIGEERLSGSIEIHLQTNDWKQHSHHVDPHYNDVVLHVVYHHTSDSCYTYPMDNHPIEMLELKSFIDPTMEQLLTSYQNLPYQAYGEHCNFFGGLSPLVIGLVLNRLGKDNLSRKIQRIRCEQYGTTLGNLFYRALFRAFGYHFNKDAMTELASIITWQEVQDFLRKGHDEDDLIALYIHVANLWDRIPTSHPYYEQLTARRDMFANDTRRVTRPWRYARVRPANDPINRLTSLCHLILKTNNGSLLQLFYRVFSTTATQLDWATCFDNLRSVCFHKQVLSYSIGESFLRILSVNVLIPFMIVYAQNEHYIDLERALFLLWEHMPSLPPNFKERRLYPYMTKAQRASCKSASIQQGLLLLYSDFCQYHQCKSCKMNQEKLISSM